MTSESPTHARTCCPGCGTEWGPRLLACPGCGKLVHAERLKQLSAEAEQATAAGERFTAIQHWRDALELLPATSRQYAAILTRVERLTEQAQAAGQTQPAAGAASTGGKSKSGTAWTAGVGGAGAIGLLLWKFKFIAVFLLGKAKLLLLGLTKLGTVFTMLASFGLYWTQWGWKFALGLVVSIYIHEMGHVASLRQHGIRAAAPMFIPGFGAFVRLKQSPLNARQDARIGLAGPIWGTAAALACLGLGEFMAWPSWIAIAHVAAWINLFNLLPVWQLDGSRGFRALDRASRVGVMILVALMWYWTGEGLLILILLVGGFRALAEPGAREPDRIAACQFALLVIVLSAACYYSPRYF